MKKADYFYRCQLVKLLYPVMSRKQQRDNWELAKDDNYSSLAATGFPITVLRVFAMKLTPLGKLQLLSSQANQLQISVLCVFDVKTNACYLG